MQENDDKEISNVEREGWNAEQLTEESVYEMPDETMRQMLRGGESGDEADERDVAGSAARNDTPQGREEAKRDSK